MVARWAGTNLGRSHIHVWQRQADQFTPDHGCVSDWGLSDLGTAFWVVKESILLAFYSVDGLADHENDSGHTRPGEAPIRCREFQSVEPLERRSGQSVLRRRWNEAEFLRTTRR